jgi:hypothetical protein
MLDSKSFGVDGKWPQTNARKARYLTRFASGNRSGQNAPNPPAADVRKEYPINRSSDSVH